MELEKPRVNLDFERFPPRVAIIGSRSFEYPPPIAAVMRNMIKTFIRKLPKDTEIVSGGARGVDTFAADAARELNRPLHEEWPDEHIPVPRRFFVRNQLIVDYVREQNGLVVAFAQVDKMRGTQHALNYAQKQGIPQIVFRFKRVPLRTVAIDVIGCEQLILSD